MARVIIKLTREIVIEKTFQFGRMRYVAVKN